MSFIYFLVLFNRINFGLIVFLLFFYSFYIFLRIKVLLIYNIVSIPAVQRSDRVIHIYIPFLISSSISGLSHETGYSSLCYRVGPHCLSIPNVIVYTCQPQSPSIPLLPSSPLATTSLLSMSMSLFPWFICAIFYFFI